MWAAHCVAWLHDACWFVLTARGKASGHARTTSRVMLQETIHPWFLASVPSLIIPPRPQVYLCNRVPTWSGRSPCVVVRGSTVQGSCPSQVCVAVALGASGHGAPACIWPRHGAAGLFALVVSSMCLSWVLQLTPTFHDGHDRSSPWQIDLGLRNAG